MMNVYHSPICDGQVDKNFKLSQPTIWRIISWLRLFH
jgi:hypothetical protein